MLGIDRLTDIVHHYEELMNTLAEPDVTSDPARFQKLMREQAELEPIVREYERHEKAASDLQDALEMLDHENDPEMREMLKAELSKARSIIGESEEKLQISLVGYELKDNYAELYYSIENLSDEAFHIESSDVLLNGEECYSLAIYQNVDANSSVLYSDSFYRKTYSRIERLSELSFGLELGEGYLNQFGKAEKIVMKFEPDGQLREFSGKIDIDKSSDFWEKAFALASIRFCPECGNQIDPDSKFCMYCGHSIN